MKLSFDRMQIGKDIRVIEFQIIQHRCSRPVVDKFGTFVEEGGVVFIGFDDEKGRNTFCILLWCSW